MSFNTDKIISNFHERMKEKPDTEQSPLGKLREGLKERVQGLVLENVDIIVVREQYLVDCLHELQGIESKKSIGILKVNNFEDLKTLDATEMEKLGWIRKESVATHG